LLKSTIPYHDLLGFIHQHTEEIILRQTLFVTMKVEKQIFLKGTHMFEFNQESDQHYYDNSRHTPFYCLHSRFKNSHTNETHIVVIDGHSYTIVNLDGDIIHSFHKAIDGGMIPAMERNLLRIEDEETYTWKMQCDDIEDGMDVDIDMDRNSLAYSSSSSEFIDSSIVNHTNGQRGKGNHSGENHHDRGHSTSDEIEAQSKSTMIYTMRYIERLDGFLIIYYDGSMSIHHYNIWTDQRTGHQSLKHFYSPRTHMVSLVAYPFPLESLHKSLQDNFLASNGSNKECVNNLHPSHPVVYERNQNKDYFSSLLTMREINNFLLLSENLQRTILRSKLVVTGKSVEEISRVLDCVVIPQQRKNNMPRRSNMSGSKQNKDDPDDGTAKKRRPSHNKKKSTEDDGDESLSALPFITPSKPPPSYQFAHGEDSVNDLGIDNDGVGSSSIANIVVLLATKHSHANVDMDAHHNKQEEKSRQHDEDIVSYSLVSMTLSVSQDISSNNNDSIRIPSAFNLSDSEYENSGKSNDIFNDVMKENESKRCEVTELQVINIGHSYVKHNADSLELCRTYTMSQVIFPDHTSVTSSSNVGYLLIQHHGIVTCRNIFDLRISYFACQVFQSHPLTDMAFFATFALNRLIVCRSSCSITMLDDRKAENENTAKHQDSTVEGVVNSSIPEQQKWFCDISLQQVLHCPTLASDNHTSSNRTYFVHEREGSLISLQTPNDSMTTTKIDNSFGLDRVHQASIQPFISSQSSSHKSKSHGTSAMAAERSFQDMSSHEHALPSMSLHDMVYNPNNIMQCVTDMQQSSIPLPKSLLSAYYSMKFHSTFHSKKYGLYVASSRDRNYSLLPRYQKACNQLISSIVSGIDIRSEMEEDAIGIKIDDDIKFSSLLQQVSTNKQTFPYLKSVQTENEYIACVIARNVHYQSNDGGTSSSSIGTKAFGKSGIVGRHSSAAYHQVRPITDSILPEVWIYSNYTKRWRNIILALADQHGNNAMIIRDIYTLDYSLGFATTNAMPSPVHRFSGTDPNFLGARMRTATEESVVSNAGSSLYTFAQAHAGSNPLQHPPDVQATQQTLDKMSIASADLWSPVSNGMTALKSIIHQIMNPSKYKSQFNHNFIQILSLHWFGTHSLILVTIRKSQCYIEVLSREPLRAAGISSSGGIGISSTNSAAGGIPNGTVNGHMMSKFHYLIPLPPGFVPIYMDCVNIEHANESNNNLTEGESPVHKRYKGLYTSCIVLVSDGRYFNAYQINARYNNHTVSSHLTDYYYRGNSRLNHQDDETSPATDPSTTDIVYVNTSINIVDYSIVELWSYTLTSCQEDKHHNVASTEDGRKGQENQNTFSMYHNVKSMKIFVQAAPIDSKYILLLSNKSIKICFSFISYFFLQINKSKPFLIFFQ
jgi:hypothetical protein